MNEENFTLGFYQDVCVTLFGEDSKATKFIEDKIKESPNGRDEKVIQHSGQVMYLLTTLDSKN